MDSVEHSSMTDTAMFTMTVCVLIVQTVDSLNLTERIHGGKRSRHHCGLSTASLSRTVQTRSLELVVNLSLFTAHLGVSMPVYFLFITIITRSSLQLLSILHRPVFFLTFSLFTLFMSPSACLCLLSLSICLSVCLSLSLSLSLSLLVFPILQYPP